MEGSDRGSDVRLGKLLRWLAGSVAGCPGLVDISREPDGRRSDASGSGPVAEQASEGATDGQRPDLISPRDRIGLGCALFLGCGVCIVALATPGMLVVLARSLLML